MTKSFNAQCLSVPVVVVVVVVVVSSLVTVRVLARVAGDLTDLCDVEIVTECHSPLPAPQFLN